MKQNDTKKIVVIQTTSRQIQPQAYTIQLKLHPLLTFNAAKANRTTWCNYFSYRNTYMLHLPKCLSSQPMCVHVKIIRYIHWYTDARIHARMHSNNNLVEHYLCLLLRLLLNALLWCSWKRHSITFHLPVISLHVFI